MATLRHWFLEWLAYWSRFLRRPDWAAGHWETVARENPRHPRAWHALAVLRAAEGRPDKALELLDRQLALRPDDAEAWFNRGFLLQKAGQHEQAIAAFDAAIGQAPALDRAWYGKAISLITLGRLAESVAPLKRNTELQPMSPYGWYQLARVKHDLGEDREVERIIRSLSRFEPKFAAQLERETGVRAAVPAP